MVDRKKSKAQKQSTPRRRIKSARPQKFNRRKGSAASILASPNVRPPSPGSEKRGEDGHIAYLLRRAQAAAHLTIDRALADLGVTPPQFSVLAMLEAYPGLSGADVARVAVLTPQTVGVIIGNLERHGAVRKTPHPVHGRMLQWALTSRGADLLQKCRRRVTVVERRLVAGLGTSAEATIRRWLSKVAVDFHEDS